MDATTAAIPVLGPGSAFPKYHEHYRFSERRGTPLCGSQLTQDKAVSLFQHVADRSGVRATARQVGVTPNTLVRYSRLSGGHARALHDDLAAFPPKHP